MFVSLFNAVAMILFSLASIARIEFGQSAGRNAFQHLLGEDAQQLPANVERLEDGAVLVVALRDKVLLELGQKLQIEQIVRSESFFADDGLHGLHVFADSVTGVL